MRGCAWTRRLWLCALLLMAGACSPQISLEVAVEGSGTTDPGPGAHPFSQKTSVQVTAIPAYGATFTGWSGAASGTANPVTVVVDGDLKLIAHFAGAQQVSHRLELGVSGDGSTAPGAGIHTYPAGAAVQVTATPANGATFTGWSGAATGTANPLTVVMDGDKTLTAGFGAARVDYTLTVAVSGNGTTVPGTGIHNYAAGAAVQVGATPASGATFAGWSGAATGTANPVTVVMDGSKTLTARFVNAGGSSSGGSSSGGSSSGGSSSGGSSSGGSSSGGTNCQPPPAGTGTNPLFTDQYTADPAALVDGCTFYITAGHDEAGQGQNAFVMREWFLLSSTDMVHWTKSVAMSLGTFRWANANAWAGQMVKARNGRFYWYVPVQEAATGAMAIGVAVADRPTGPWTDAIGKPLVNDAFEMSNMGFGTAGDTPYTIDPTVFVDDDGQAYLHYGGFWRMVAAKLNPDMVSISGRMVESTPPGYWESPYLIKRNGRYYEIYASGSNPGPIDYATSNSPMGPWTQGGRVLDPMPQAPGNSDAPTNHAGVAELAGQWYLVYHRSDGPNGGGTYRREVAVDKLTFSGNGSIQKVTPSPGMSFSGGSSSGGNSSGGSSSGGSSSGGSSSGGSSSGGACDWSAPPANVSRWIDESWNAQLTGNISNRRAWLLDSAMQGKGVINLCIRWSATTTFTTAWRDQIASSMASWFNGWFEQLDGYGCFPYPRVTVKITGIAVKPGQESILGWTDRTIPVYTETDRGTDPPGEPKCPDACSFFANWNHQFPGCPGGEANHFDYDIWLGDTLPGGAGAVGGDWGVRMPRASFTGALGSPDFNMGQHEIGHGFGMQDYYDWTGSTPAGGSIMIVGSAWGGPTVADGWLLRRVWKEQKAKRGW